MISRRIPEKFRHVSSRSTRHIPLITWGLVVASLIVQAGCSTGSGDRGDKDPSATSAEVEVERGPVRVVARITPDPARLSDEVVLVFEVVADRGLSIEMPPFGQAFDDYIIRDFREQDTEIRGDQQVLRHEYRLEPDSTGTHELGPFTVQWSDRPDREPEVLETPPLMTEVSSVVEADVASLDDLAPAEQPVALPDSRPSMWWFAGGLLVLLAACVAGILWLKRTRVEPAVQRTPREIAYEQLRELKARGLDRVDVKQYFTELSQIVRGYIEGTTGVLASEQTTEEFLRDEGTRKRFSLADQDQLKAFLETADLVKFARMEPDREVVRRAWQQAWEFVDQPRDADAETVEVNE